MRPVITVLGRSEQEDIGFKGSLDYTVRLCLKDGEGPRPSLRTNINGIKMSSSFHWSGRPRTFEVHASFINYPLGPGCMNLRLRVPGIEFPLILKFTVPASRPLSAP